MLQETHLWGRQISTAKPLTMIDNIYLDLADACDASCCTLDVRLHIVSEEAVDDISCFTSSLIQHLGSKLSLLPHVGSFDLST